MSCGHECSCPSKLHHDVDYIIRRYDAPIPPPSASWIIGELRAAMGADAERREDLAGNTVWTKVTPNV